MMSRTATRPGSCWGRNSEGLDPCKRSMCRGTRAGRAGGRAVAEGGSGGSGVFSWIFDRKKAFRIWSAYWQKSSSDQLSPPPWAEKFPKFGHCQKAPVRQPRAFPMVWQGRFGERADIGGSGDWPGGIPPSGSAKRPSKYRGGHGSSLKNLRNGASFAAAMSVATRGTGRQVENRKW